MRSYQTARSLFSFLEFMAWTLVVVGVFLALVLPAAASEMAAFSRAPSMLVVIVAMIPGAALALPGLLCAAIVQNGRASVDSAELSQQMLKVARDQLELSKRALAASRPAGRDSYVDRAPVPPPPARATPAAAMSRPQTPRTPAVGAPQEIDDLRRKTPQIEERAPGIPVEAPKPHADQLNVSTSPKPGDPAQT